MMKKFTILAAVAALSLCLDVRGQDDKKEGDTPKAPAWFAKLDKNHDGKVTEDEADRGWKRIARLDQNGDGAVSEEEAATRGVGKDKAGKAQGHDGAGADHDGKRGMGAGRGNAMAGLFARLDKNKDGSLSQDEAGKAWERIKGLDTDKNGSVSKEEAAVIAKRGADRKNADGKNADRKNKGKDRVGVEKNVEKARTDRIAGLFARMDKNHDGKITEDEAGEMWERLGKHDADGDGAVTADELASRKEKGGDGQRQRDGR